MEPVPNWNRFLGFAILKWPSQMTIIKSIMYADFEEPRLHDHDLEILNLRKNCHFCLENLLICL